jgi:hypothetical protein
MKAVILFSTIIFTAGLVFSTYVLVDGLTGDDLDIKGIRKSIDSISAGIDAMRKDMQPMQVYVTNMPEPTRMLSPNRFTNIIEKIEKNLK